MPKRPFKLMYDGRDFHLVMNLSSRALCGIGRDKLDVSIPARERVNDRAVDWTVTCKKCQKEAMEVW